MNELRQCSICRTLGPRLAAFPVLLAAVLSSGCLSLFQRPVRLIVFNATSAPVRGLTVTGGDQTVLRADALNPQAEAGPVSLPGGVPPRMIVQWQGAKNEAVRRIVPTQEMVPRRTAGLLRLRITATGDVVGRFAPTSAPDSDLPWNERQSWEGVIPMPGLQ